MHLDFIYDGLLNGHSPDVIANALHAPHLQLSTAWIYELLDREVANGEDECKNLLGSVRISVYGLAPA